MKIWAIGACLALAALGADPGVAADGPGPVDLLKAQTEQLRAETESIKAGDARLQFFMDWGYKVAVAVVAVCLLIWLIPQVSEVSLPWAGGIVNVKRARKEPLPAPPTPATEPVLTEATEVLKKTLVPGPATDRLVDRLEEVDVYRQAGVSRDEIYICHHAKKLTRSEHYHIQIYLDAETPDILDRVERIVYRLHPTFPQPERGVTDRKSLFELRIAAWGEFMLYGQVYFKGVPRPVELKRYLNF